MHVHERSLLQYLLGMHEQMHDVHGVTYPPPAAAKKAEISALRLLDAVGNVSPEKSGQLAAEMLISRVWKKHKDQVKKHKDHVQVAVDAHGHTEEQHRHHALHETKDAVVDELYKHHAATVRRQAANPNNLSEAGGLRGSVQVRACAAVL